MFFNSNIKARLLHSHNIFLPPMRLAIKHSIHLLLLQRLCYMCKPHCGRQVNTFAQFQLVLWPLLSLEAAALPPLAESEPVWTWRRGSGRSSLDAFCRPLTDKTPPLSHHGPSLATHHRSSVKAQISWSVLHQTISVCFQSVKDLVKHGWLTAAVLPEAVKNKCSAGVRTLLKSIYSFSRLWLDCRYFKQEQTLNVHPVGLWLHRFLLLFISPFERVVVVVIVALQKHRVAASWSWPSLWACR